MSEKNAGTHGARVFVAKTAKTTADVDWLVQRGYGVQDGGPSGLLIVWSDGYADTLDFTENPDAELERVVAARKLIPFTVDIEWWDDIERSGGALTDAFGPWSPLLVAVRNKNSVTVSAMREALSYAARHQGDTKGGAR